MRGEEDNGRGVQRDDILREEDATLGRERERGNLFDRKGRGGGDEGGRRGDVRLKEKLGRIRV